MSSIFELEPEQYTPHALHLHERNFRETNCYVDLVIELVHALGCEPLACLGFPITTELEGDQWTFFKPPTAALERLYGVRIEELSLFRTLVEHVVEQTSRGRVPLIEVDSFHLPDTSGSDYGTAHTKTTIGVVHADPSARTLRYFHNAGFYALSGDDFDGLLTPAIAQSAGYLPPYCEILKPDRAVVRPARELRAIARDMLAGYLEQLPRENPLRAYAAMLPEHMARIASGGMPAYHSYSFAGLRQLGASFELCGAHLRWLADGGGEHGTTYAEASAAFGHIGATAKTLILKLARVAMNGKPQDFSAAFAQMSEDWEKGIAWLSRTT
jgi:hypothetical protein